MQTITVVVGPDGRVAIPGTHAGEMLIIHVERKTTDPPPAIRYSPEEIERLKEEILAGAKRVREKADPAWLNLDHDDWLYDENGLPR